ncbi:Crp/Fnr family transcriptional regulator [Chitinispirillales bacterium ANBcel5]|uniref:Crp/Fnr family transcriptional regulator n=1 Tax=Cellulosispirillum alkaliphilum TaxID=3039283 RepID=UPI002A54279E|nr:Crp/Fnr family transcriptional regulator [Chitinispirillales bacterium ANBcel5]
MQNSKKTGAAKGVLNRDERFYKRGTLIFIEGERSREMFVIRSGKVRVIRQEGEHVIELATLGAGSLLGELSLLDDKPRSATAQVTEDTMAMVIDHKTFESTVSAAPKWLECVLKVIVTRLRSALEKKDQERAFDSISGVIRVLLILSQTEPVVIDNTTSVPLSRLKDTVNSVMGIGGLEVEKVLHHLIVKQMVVIRKNKANREFVLIKDPAVLSLYMNFLRVRQDEGRLMGESFSDGAFELVSKLLSIGLEYTGKNGSKTVEITGKEMEMSLQGQNESTQNTSFRELLDSKLIRVGKKKAGDRTIHLYNYNLSLLKNVYLLKNWLPVFRENLCI